MATGMPCIVSRTSAPREYFSKDFGWWAEMSDEFVSTEMFQKGQPGSWRLPDAESLEQYMKEAYEDRQTCYRKGRAAAEFVKENLNWRKTAEGLVKIAEEFDNAENISDNPGIQRASIVTHLPGQLYRVCG
jgi:glycosyltransferase involved in cell wall biosynthesis